MKSKNIYHSIKRFMITLFAVIQITTTAYGTEIDTQTDIQSNTESVKTTISFPETFVDIQGSYAVNNISEYVETGFNFKFTVSEKITRLEIIYSGDAPEIYFFDTKHNCYMGENKTYSDGMSILKRNHDDIYAIGSKSYNMSVYYIEYPQNSGDWIASLANPGNIGEFVVAETSLPLGWRYSKKEPRAEVTGRMWYSLVDTSYLADLITEDIETEPVHQETVETTEKVVKKDYSGFILLGGIVVLFVGVFIGISTWSKNKSKKEALAKEKEKMKEARKLARIKTPEEQMEEFNAIMNEYKYDSEEDVSWSVEPNLIEVEDSKIEVNTTSNMEKIAKANSRFAESRPFFDSNESINESPATPKIPNIPSVPNVPDPSNKKNTFF